MNSDLATLSTKQPSSVHVIVVKIITIYVYCSIIVPFFSKSCRRKKTMKINSSKGKLQIAIVLVFNLLFVTVNQAS